jgi:hypothetical protein
VNTHRCCQVAPVNQAQSTAGNPRQPIFLRRCFRIAEWIVPGALLALLPKCPLCLVAYIAIATGVGLSLSAATYLRLALVFVCVASLLMVAVRWCVAKLRRVTIVKDYR